MNLFKSFSLYTIASFVERGIAFLLLPIFTFYLSTEDFGILALVTSVFSFTTPLINLGVQGAISVAYFNGSRVNYPSYFSSSIFPPLVITLFLIFLLLMFKSYVEDFFEIPFIWILSLPFFGFLSFFNSLVLVDYQIKNEASNYVIFSISSSTLNILISLFLVVSLGFSYQGRLIGQYSSITIFFIISIYILYNKRKLLVKNINWLNIKNSLTFGLPLVPHMIGGLVISMSDRLFIDHFWGKEQLGIYNVGHLIGSAISIIGVAFANAIIPFSYELFSINTLESKVKVVKVYWIFIVLLLFIVFCVWIFTPLVFKWFIDEKFVDGSKYVIWITLGYFFQGLYLLFANIIFYLKKTILFFYLSFGNILINLGLNYFLVPILGPIGSALSTFLSFFLFFVTVASFCNKVYPLPWFSPFSKK